MKSLRSQGLMFAVGGRPSNPGFKLKWSMVCWALFLAGLLIQLAAPRLKIEHNQFVLPGSMMSANRPVSPSQIVARERWMQLLSAVLTAGGALGLGICHYSGSLRSHANERRPLKPGSESPHTRGDALA